MIHRVTEASGLKAVMASTPALTNVYCDLDEWIKVDNNLAFVDEEGVNFGAFEFVSHGVVMGHYFFGSARGRKAINLAKEIIDRVFNVHEIVVIQGLTPTHHKAALWMNRQLGFKPYQIIDTEAGPHQIFALTKSEWNNAA